MSKDVIADFLTIIRNGIARSKFSVAIYYSKIRHEIARILKEEGYISDFLLEEYDGKKQMTIILKYVDGESVIHEVARISKPSCRVYKGKVSIKPVIGGLGISILTTNKGVMTDKTAKQLGVGGELICTVW